MVVQRRSKKTPEIECDRRKCRGYSKTLKKLEDNEFIALPETNMAPENTRLEKEIPIGNHHFWVLG